jgi:hypothetical protein
MICNLCQTSGSFVTAADRRCAFGPDGRFRPENLHCGTMEALRGLAVFRVLGSDGFNVTTISGPDGVLVLAWRGSFARVGYAAVLVPLGDAIASAFLDLPTAERLIESKTRRVS